MVEPTELSRSISACMDNYGVEADGNEWSNNMLSPRTVRGPAGQLGLPGEVAGAPDAQELERCARLATAAAEVVPELQTGMGSEGGEELSAFFVVAHDGFHCRTLNAGELRAIFGGALYAKAAITVEPMDETSEWWRKVEADCASYAKADASVRGSLEAWRKLLAWFHAQKEFVELAFVAIDKTDDGMPGGCVFPRLLLGGTTGGSVAGLFGCVVYS